MNYNVTKMGAYNVHTIKTNKFKTITVEINFRRPIVKEEITIRNILKAVLLNSNSYFPTEKDLIKETEDLYDLKLLSSNNRIGNYTNLSFKIRFLDEKYVDDMANLDCIKFLLDIIFKPNIKNNSFKDNIVDDCKRQLEKSLLLQKDNKLKYSLFKLLETEEDYPYSYNPYGYLSDLKDINGKVLYDYYKSVVSNDIVDIFIVGNIDEANIKDIFREYFNTRTLTKDYKNTIVKELKPTNKINVYKELDNVNQTQLTMLCSVNNLTDFERKYTLMVYNEMLGGSSNSILFDTVREKNSYAYYVNSINKSYDNILMIYSGIEPGREEEVIKLVKKSLSNIVKGNFNENILNNAKETLISSIKASLDSPAGIINTYYAKELVGADTFEDRIENINKVSIEDIIEVSKKVKIHSIFTLESEEISSESN
jgi:predicted Zn-dependent peptidase